MGGSDWYNLMQRNQLRIGMDTEKVLLETYRKWSDETLIRAMSTFTRDGGVARKPYLQALRERGLEFEKPVSTLLGKS
jgi:mannitol/fructose-specific phosphotransferase system IIA component